MITVDLQNYANVQQQLAIARLTPAKQRRLLIAISRAALSDNKKRVRTQQLADGGQFQARSAKTPPRKRNKKMLVKLGQRLQFRNVTDSEVVLGWQNNLTGYIAGKQQTGSREIKTKAQLARSGTPKTSPATARQAAELLANGYKIPRGNGRGYKTPSKRWIMQNLTAGKAGAILKALRGDGKEQWPIVLPARPAFGFADADIQKYLEIALKTITPKSR